MITRAFFLLLAFSVCLFGQTIYHGGSANTSGWVSVPISQVYATAGDSGEIPYFNKTGKLTSDSTLCYVSTATNNAVVLDTGNGKTASLSVVGSIGAKFIAVEDSFPTTIYNPDNGVNFYNSMATYYATQLMDSSYAFIRFRGRLSSGLSQYGWFGIKTDVGISSPSFVWASRVSSSYNESMRLSRTASGGSTLYLSNSGVRALELSCNTTNSYVGSISAIPFNIMSNSATRLAFSSSGQMSLPIFSGGGIRTLNVDNSGIVSAVASQSIEDSAVSYSASQTIPSNVQQVTVTGTGAIVLTLPLATADGANYSHVINIKSIMTGGTLTVQRQSTNVLYLIGSNSSTTSTTVTQGGQFHFVSNGLTGSNGHWYQY